MTILGLAKPLCALSVVTCASEVATQSTSGVEATQLSAETRLDPEGGWTTWDLFPVPSSLIFSRPDFPLIIVSCPEHEFSIQVRDLPPAQAFPQPTMAVQIGADVWSGSPVAHYVGSQTALDLDFSTAENVMRDKRTMAAISEETAVRITFGEETFDLPPIPRDLGTNFAQYCLSVWHLP